VGVKSNILGGLLSRFLGQPAIACLLSYRAQERVDRGDDPRFLLTYNGENPTEELARTLADAMYIFERIRIEVLESMSEPKSGLIPACRTEMLGSIFTAEQLLVRLIDLSVDMVSKASQEP
jgi:hypothetical protein